jgi:hypothetical protein
MKHLLMKKFGPLLGIALLAATVLAFTMMPSSCSSLTTEQQQRLQAISVPLASLGLGYAQSEGWIEPGDRITLTRGVAVVTSPADAETKLFKLAELGLESALNRGLVNGGDVITVTSPSQASIQSPSPFAPTTSAKQPVVKLLPAP